jgi:hypothetical protein
MSNSNRLYLCTVLNVPSPGPTSTLLQIQFDFLLGFIHIWHPALFLVSLNSGEASVEAIVCYAYGSDQGTAVFTFEYIESICLFTFEFICVNVWVSYNFIVNDACCILSVDSTSSFPHLILPTNLRE